MKKLGFGLMRLPVVAGDYHQVDMERFKKMADAFIAAGGTYFDTAYLYHGGASELALREAVVERYPREAYTVTDKMPLSRLQTEEDLTTIFADQLKKTGLTYFDYYWLHALGDHNAEKAENLHAFDFVKKLKAEGKAKHIGFSFHGSPELLEKTLKNHPEVECVQLQLNYIDWDDASVRAKECYEICCRYQKPVIVMEPVKGGALVKVPAEAEALMKETRPELSVASWALRYAASKENVMTVLSGMSDEAQVSDNVSFMMDFEPLSEREQAVVARTVELIRNQIAVPCTGCRYCVSEQNCPMNIPIPDIFALYNDVKAFRTQHFAAMGAYQKLTENTGKAGECLGCGMCEAHCPQGLSIREFLAEAAKTLEKE